MNKIVNNAIIYGMIMLAMCFVSCSDDDPLDSEQEQVLPEQHDEWLVGSWRFVKSLGDGTGYKVELDLKEDGTGSDGSASLKWLTTDNKL